MKSYSAFAYVYDQLMEDVDYDEWIVYIEDIFKRYDINPQNIAELACGTGNITNRLAKRGYNMIGVDIAEDMLYVASQKAQDMDLDVVYLNQDITDLLLPTHLDTILCICDGVNYIIGEEDLLKVFQGVYDHLKENGCFIFDISSYYKLSQVLGNHTYAENLEEVSYIWENYFDEKNSICNLDLTLFIKEGDFYKKYEEDHIQRAYKEKEIINILKQVGFKKIESFDAFTFLSPKKTSERVYFVCQK
ncbi:class I SAM-dependent DNA methyltransferase [Inediibacterium massiliense]|uniref:class I SAM-dependent DNA methyltransferase n=1 Tax=Inediibacterium massiliense TaxID=1658111 RepID=UPI0006B57311|nr:class I SAM-dependent methyltransferase [Inediibacterium massiliense]